ncbi:hypothetical protein B5T_01218 [Alloalcanivorax dieselolei B5]|uniref:Uncharacterized protein n=1 Tax=Alcanivorax dieselolei (strain DSM 16502 / CGMCC 1.3690 / MCCC 1A00001 / B-5) TaxID=930169 RepID=K0CD57_ALCDB|nr:hypothetical protein B5T_01218 [Alloalcanivorax dieselolei B5]
MSTIWSYSAISNRQERQHHGKQDQPTSRDSRKHQTDNSLMIKA